MRRRGTKSDSANAALAERGRGRTVKANGSGQRTTVIAETSASTLSPRPGDESTLAMTISNSGSVGNASVSSMTLSGCGTNGVCTVTAASAPGTPWSGITSQVAGNPYLKISGFENRITYGGSSCAASGLTFKYRGSIGGLFQNASSTLVFNAASAEATGSSLTSVGTTQTGYEAEYKVQMTGAHAGQALTLS